MKKHVPWGEKVPVHLIGEGRVRKGKMAFTSHLDPSLSVPLATDRYKVLKAIVENRWTSCLLMYAPESEKIFAQIVGDVYLIKGVSDEQIIEFHYEETSYLEDYYKRQGLP